jgi:predicted small integral membrane protein
MTFDVDVVRRTASGDFLVGWVAFGADFAVRFRAFTNTLAGVGTVREVTVPGETPRNIRLSLFPPTGEVMAAWLGTVGSTQTTLRWLPNALTSPQPQIANAFAGTSSDLALGGVTGGAAAFWAQGLPQPRLVGLTLGADSGVAVDFTPSGVTGLFAPGLAPLPGGTLQVGYEADRGAGLDLYGQVVCRP